MLNTRGSIIGWGAVTGASESLLQSGVMLKCFNFVKQAAEKERREGT
jgi:hypothetical protein